jgi:hypothetical protein
MIAGSIILTMPSKSQIVLFLRLKYKWKLQGDRPGHSREAFLFFFLSFSGAGKRVQNLARRKSFQITDTYEWNRNPREISTNLLGLPQARWINWNWVHKYLLRSYCVHIAVCVTDRFQPHTYLMMYQQEKWPKRKWGHQLAFKIYKEVMNTKSPAGGSSSLVPRRGWALSSDRRSQGRPREAWAGLGHRRSATTCAFGGLQTDMLPCSALKSKMESQPFKSFLPLWDWSCGHLVLLFSCVWTVMLVAF